MQQFVRNPRIEADVQLLLGRFRDLLPDGRIVAHEEVEALLQLNRKANRYQTVTTRWRRVLLDEQRIFLDGRSALGHGFKSLTPDDMVRYSNRRVRSVGRILKKAIYVAGLPDPSELSSSELRTFQARLFVACEQVLSTHRRVLVDLTKAMQPPRQLPRAVR